MIPRVLEPEVMDTPEEAAEYDAMDHAEVNRAFVDDWLAAMSAAGRELGREVRVLDVGTGTALIPLELCRRTEFAGQVVGVDLAEAMLHVGRQNVEAAGLGQQVRVELVDAKSLPYEDGAFDGVISNSIVHHIPEPDHVLKEMVRVLRPGGVLFVRDLLRPDSQAEVERLVAAYAGKESVNSQQLFRQSLQAALTVAEMQELASVLDLPRDCVRPTSGRHWTLIARG